MCQECVLKLLAKLIAGDVVAQEFKYHPACLVGPYNRERHHRNIEHGVAIKSHLNNGVFKSDIAVAQLSQYNYFFKFKDGTATHRHSKDHKTPFAVYIGMALYANT